MERYVGQRNLSAATTRHTLAWPEVEWFGADLGHAQVVGLGFQLRFDMPCIWHPKNFQEHKRPSRMSEDMTWANPGIIDILGPKRERPARPSLNPQPQHQNPQSSSTLAKALHLHPQLLYSSYPV